MDLIMADGLNGGDSVESIEAVLVKFLWFLSLLAVKEEAAIAFTALRVLSSGTRIPFYVNVVLDCIN